MSIAKAWRDSITGNRTAINLCEKCSVQNIRSCLFWEKSGSMISFRCENLPQKSTYFKTHRHRKQSIQFVKIISGWFSLFSKDGMAFKWWNNSSSKLKGFTWSINHNLCSKFQGKLNESGQIAGVSTSIVWISMTKSNVQLKCDRVKQTTTTIQSTMFCVTNHN